MQPKERVLAALRHEEPDRVPLFYRDVPEIEERLCRDLGLPDREALLQYFEIDFRWVGPRYVGPPLHDEYTGHARDIWGTEYRYVRAGHGGYWEPVAFPLADVYAPAALDDYPWPRLEWFDFSVLDAQLEAYRDYAIMTAPGDASPGVMTTIQSLLGMERALTDMLLHPEFYRALIDHIMAFECTFVEELFSRAGGRIDFFRIGDDFGTQEGLLIGPRQWREFIRPTMTTLSGIARAHGAHYYHHSCGSVRDLIPELIDAGVDVLQALQFDARGMDAADLKERYGDRLCFEGGISVQRTLPFGTVDEVAAEVRERIRVLGRGGGYILGPSHAIQAGTPPENIVALFDTALEFGRYTK